MNQNSFTVFNLISNIIESDVDRSKKRASATTSKLQKQKQVQLLLSSNASKAGNFFFLTLLSPSNSPITKQQIGDEAQKQKRERSRRRVCNAPDCPKLAQGPASFCYAHGGGYRCVANGCNRAARDGSRRCIRHGGGRKCLFPGCISASRGKSGRCIRHGGGIRCSHVGCPKSVHRKGVGMLRLLVYSFHRNIKSVFGFSVVRKWYHLGTTLGGFRCKAWIKYA
eukprot:snap_masked-scaffold_1-processed-gene-27.21-mRNA-1 protein AED:0.24 eAED:0.24 QI:0/0/0/0.66/1/1/3/0/223